VWRILASPAWGVNSAYGLFRRRNLLCDHWCRENPGAEKILLTLFWKWTIGVALALFLVAFIGLSLMAGSPRDAYGMVRYALPHMHRGKLKVGDDAPDARLVALNGSDRFHIRERTGAKPLVLVFGSFT
jgi:hypothetical protein